MKMDLDTRTGIALDLASLSRYETLEVIEGRISESSIQIIGSAKSIAENYRARAKQRLELIANDLQILQKGIDGDYIRIRECIQQLDTFIASQQEES